MVKYILTRICVKGQNHRKCPSLWITQFATKYANCFIFKLLAISIQSIVLKSSRSPRKDKVHHRMMSFFIYHKKIISFRKSIFILFDITKIYFSILFLLKLKFFVKYFVRHLTRKSKKPKIKTENIFCNFFENCLYYSVEIILRNFDSSKIKN